MPYPKQYPESIGTDATLIIDYDDHNPIKAKIIRDDMEEPYLTVFQTEDGHIILSTECIYRMEKPTQRIRPLPLQAGSRVKISGDSKDLWIHDYNVRVDSEATIIATPKPRDKTIMVTIDEIDNDRNVTTFVKRSGVKEI